MTELLEEATARVRELPPKQQDMAAEAIFAVVERDQPRYRLTPEQIEEVRRTQADLKAGRTRLLTDEEVEAMWRRLGV